ncbi:MAG: hypothetical protein ACKVZH_10255 [Blastocatellia bacterium]
MGNDAASKTLALALESGSRAFSASSGNSNKAICPIRHLPQPVTDALHIHLRVDDPWKQNRRTQKDSL